MSLEVQGFPEERRVWERLQLSKIGQSYTRARYGSRSPNFVLSSWFEVERVRDVMGGHETLLIVPGNKSTGILAETCDRFKKQVAVVGVAQSALSEILSSHARTAPAVIATRAGRTLAGILPNGLEDLYSCNQNSGWEIGLRVGYSDFRASIGGFDGLRRQAFVPSRREMWISEPLMPIKDLAPGRNFT
jgi:hypothetical protein